jgi:hypothetical protein
MITFVVAPGGDWEGLYIDDKLVIQNHSLDWQQVLEALKIKYECFEADEVWMAESGALPENFNDVKFQDTNGSG